MQAPLINSTLGLWDSPSGKPWQGQKEPAAGTILAAAGFNPMRPNHPRRGDHMTAALLPRVWQKRNLLAALETLCIMGIAATAAFASEPAAIKVDALTLSRHIDQAITKRLAAEQIKSSPVADHAEFLRPVYLDITSVIPTAAAAA